MVLLGAYIVSLIFIFVFLRRRGEKQSETKKLRGYEIEDVKLIKKLLKKLNLSDLINDGD